MSFNNSSSIDDVLIKTNLVVNMTLLSGDILITILYGVSIAALILAKDVNIKVRVILINVIAAHILGTMVPNSIGYLHRTFEIFEHVIVCKIFFLLRLGGYLLKLCGTTLFSFVVYLFTKYGITKLNWSIVIPFLLLSWTVSVVFGALGLIDQDLGESYCTALYDSVLFFTLIALGVLFKVVFLSITLVFNILTFCFVHKNTINDKTKIAILKLSVFFFIESILDDVGALLPSIFVPIIVANPNKMNVQQIYVARMIIRIIVFIPPALTPIVMIILLKPLREALKQAQKKLSIYLKCKAQSSEETQ